MRIEKIEIKPLQDSINPEMVFDIELQIVGGKEIPLVIIGSLSSVENKKISNIYEPIHERNKNIELSAGRGNKEEKLLIKVNAPLNSKVLDYIETLRTKTPKGDVILTLDIVIKTLISRTVLSPMFLLERGTLDLPKKYEDAELIFYQYQNDFSPSLGNMWILSGEGGPHFIGVRTNYFNEKITIPSSDWIHDYCPVFQIGKFAVFEYLIPEYTEGAGNIEERLNHSISAIKKMEDHIIKGEWNEVIEDSRAVWELLRNQNEITDLLRRDGYTEEASTDLNESIKKLFDLSSKFHHEEDKGKRVMAKIKASKEDAYLIYTISINLVNLISKKIQRLGMSDFGNESN